MRNTLRKILLALPICALVFGVNFLQGCKTPKKINLSQGTHISLIGNNLCSRMMNFGHFETEMYLRFPEKDLYIRNFCDGGDTPGFRPHSGRNTPWAFEGAEAFNPDVAENSHSEGHFEYPDEWLTRHKTDVILACFGFNESYRGPEGLDMFKAELTAFIEHTMAQKYNDTTAPQLAFISPIAFQDLSSENDLPTGVKENENLKLYANAIEEIANKFNISFINAFDESKSWYALGEQLTIDGSQLNDKGYEKFSKFIADQAFGGSAQKEDMRPKIKELVLDKNWFWHNDYKIPNGVHVFGRRHNPFGPDNYPDELIKERQMTANRDTLLWETLKGNSYDLALADSKTQVLSPVETNFKMGESIPYIYGEEAMRKFNLAPGYKIELFASEETFPDLANPSQMSFDNKGRLWVAVMPSYPHYRVGDARPNDKILILEDTDGDYKADKQTVFADGLHVPAGFEIAPEGVYISQGTNLKLYTDTDGDDKADKVEILMSGFDDHDTHHVISAFCADPSGAIYMGEGVFLHTNVETSYGPVRATNGGFMRYNPARHHLERTSQIPIPNPWGIAFDQWGQNFFAETSGPNVEWMMPGSNKSIYGLSSPKSRSLVEDKHRVRPTSGLEFVHSRHFPEEVQGNWLINNTIGFLGMKMHTLEDDGTGYKSKHVLDLVTSSDPNFRPVDMEFAPDGSLYFIDWHNVLIGHMQHNARDPLRDHVHGKVYRITYPSRPLVPIAKVDGASVEQLLENLKLPEYRTRYRTRRELRGRDKKEVYTKTEKWVKSLDKNDPDYKHHLLEALWVSWGINKINPELLNEALAYPDERVRAAAVKVLRYVGHQIPDQPKMLVKAASDESGRVRLEAMVASTWLKEDETKAVFAEFAKLPIDDWMDKHYEFAQKPFNGLVSPSSLKTYDTPLEKQMAIGKEIYNRDGSCATCHQPDGNGLESSQFPPLAGSKWVMGSKDRVIKIVLHGLYGPIEVLGKKYPGNVPMTPYGGMLKDEEVVAVINYARNSFGNTSSDAVTLKDVQRVRTETKDQKGFFTPDELLKLHPHN